MPTFPSPTRRLAAGALVAALSVAALGGCGSDQDHSGMSGMDGSSSRPMGSATSTVADQGDVMFAQGMVPHHQQAVEMADLALQETSGASNEVRALAQEIAAAQGPEIATMQGWLTSWGAPTSMPMDHEMEGMMSEQAMQDLAAATGGEFDRLWLGMMIEHHEGAVRMAQQVLATTTNPEVEQLARAIVDGQQREITTMNELLT